MPEQSIGIIIVKWHIATIYIFIKCKRIRSLPFYDVSFLKSPTLCQIFSRLGIIRPCDLIPLVSRISKRLFLPLVLIQIFPKGSISIAFPEVSSTVLNPKRASQFILKVIVPSPILFIRSHVPIPEVSLALAFLCPLQKVIILSGQIQSIGNLPAVSNFHTDPVLRVQFLQFFLWYNAFLLSYPVSQSVVLVPCLFPCRIHCFFQTVDCTIDILLLPCPVFKNAC